MTSNILVCGGAGYIGSHMVQRLLAMDFEVVVLDNFSTGHEAAIEGVDLFRCDIRDGRALDECFRSRNFDAVMHFCASSLVGESVSDPLGYYHNNVSGTINLLQKMREHGVGKLVFSSTAAVYGEPRTDLIDESHPREPINPYGHSKHMVEQILTDAALAHNLRSVSLRYFNAAGASPDGIIGESHQPETHLIPNVLKAALGTGPTLKLFGNDYSTPDGTCVRDYVHVDDLARAHLAALNWMQDQSGAHCFNLGNGQGFSVLEIIEAARRVTEAEIKYSIEPRRPGDPPVLVASSDKARRELGWEPQHTEIEDIIETAWQWHKTQRY